MEFYTQRIIKTASDESKKLVKLTPEIKLAMTKIGRGKYKSKTSGIEWGIVDIDGVPHLARLENEESMEKVASIIENRRTVMEDITKTAMQPFGAGEPGPVEHNVEFSDLSENDPTVDMLTMADQFESPESLIAEIAIKYNMSDEEAMSLFEDVKNYVTKFSSTLDQRIVTAWCRF